ncbi:Polycomb group protein Pc-like [Homarus americanus]|uniref:Polycomb group protein Pc-like n=1 Tax=Homarus americanus TaxID=6706 RepID=A0A8J5N6A2_HOMAM|nr:Polycomb group protein Pc-like [Homarus americanus]
MAPGVDVILLFVHVTCFSQWVIRAPPPGVYLTSLFTVVTAACGRLIIACGRSEIVKDSSDSPPPKLPRLSSPKSPSHAREDQHKSPKTPQSTGTPSAPTSPAPQTPKTPKSPPPTTPTSESPAGKVTTESPVSAPQVPDSPHLNGDAEEPVTNSTETAIKEDHEAGVYESESVEETGEDAGEEEDEEEEEEVLVAPDPSYWYKRNPLADEIFITDVTANLITVTIRECKTRQGFFKGTDENQNSQSSIK